MEHERDQRENMSWRKGMAATATIAAMASAGLALGHRLDPTFGDRGRGTTWRRFQGLEADPRLVGAATPSFNGIDQDGRAVTAQTFHGIPWISDFVYTRCQGLCPMLTARLVALQRSLTDDRVRFVSFSVDPANDTPAVLKAYAERWHGDSTRWRLLATDAATLSRLVAGLGGPAADPAPDSGAIPHSDRFTLVDGQGRIRGSYLATEASEVAQLSADVASLLNGGDGGAR